MHDGMQVGPDDTLRHVADELMRLDVAQLPVLHYPANALVPELLHLACLAGILRGNITYPNLYRVTWQWLYAKWGAIS